MNGFLSSLKVSSHANLESPEVTFFGGVDRVPIDEDEGERPRGENPADGAAHAHETEFFLGIMQMREGDGVRDRDRRHIQQGVDEHETEEGGKIFSPIHTENGQPTDQVTDGHEFFRREIPVRELVAEEDTDHGGNGEGTADPGDLHGGEI